MGAGDVKKRFALVWAAHITDTYFLTRTAKTDVINLGL